MVGCKINYNYSIKSYRMQRLFFVVLVCVGIGCTSAKKTGSVSFLNGEWMPIKQEIAGTVLPAAAFSKQILIIKDSTYSVTAESVDKGIVHVNGNKMDIYGKDGVNKGKHFTAIYKLENKQLCICYNLTGNGYPESFDTKGKPKYFLCVFAK